MKFWKIYAFHNYEICLCFEICFSSTFCLTVLFLLFFSVSCNEFVILFMLCLQVAPYERPALSKAYLFPEGKSCYLYYTCCVLLSNSNCLRLNLISLSPYRFCIMKVVFCRNCKTSRIPCLCWKWRGEITS